MNKLWDDLKDNMKEWGVSAVEKAEEISTHRCRGPMLFLI